MKYFTIESMNSIFEILDKCDGVKQAKIYHPEVDLLNHSLQTFKHATRETIDIDLLMAALLHDVGKIVISKGHEKESVKILENYISLKTSWLIENHMKIWTYILGEMKRYKKVKDMVEHPWLIELIQLARFDKLGRKENYHIVYDKETIVKILNHAVFIHWRV